MKKLQDDIYIAPGMKCKKINDNQYIVRDEKNNTDLNPHDIEHKILIYEREQTGWFLETAKELLELESFIYAPIVMMVCVSYLEGVEQYKIGQSSQGKSAKFVENSLKKIYPEIESNGDENLKKFYHQVRCGLFHEASLKGGVTFGDGTNYPKSIEISEEGIKINPRKLLKDITKDFRKYIADLKNPENVDKRENFEKIFNIAPS